MGVGGLRQCAGPEVSPLLRWAGGKQRLLPHLMAACPADLNQRIYCEPFFGAGSLFFAIAPEHALIGDANPNLMAFYNHVRHAPQLVSILLGRLKSDTTKDMYYRVRDMYNRKEDTASQAARFLYLNRTCFNGVFRVNTRGKFNVPYGYKANPLFPTLEHLKSVSNRLSTSQLHSGDFLSLLSRVPPRSFVYLDPPYPPLNGTSYFAHYTMDRFSGDDQVRLADAAASLGSAGVKLLISNADTPIVRRLYREWNFRGVPVVRYVTCKKKKHVVREVLITNY